MGTIINIDRKINLLAADIKLYIAEKKLTPDNPAKCAWEMAKVLKDGTVLIDELDDAIMSYSEVVDTTPQKSEISHGNLSQTMRDLFIDKGMTINEIHHVMNCKYVRVKNVIKKIPNWQKTEEKNKKKHK